MRNSNRRRRQTETVRPAPVDRGDQIHVDVFMLWGEPLKDTALFMDRVRREAALSGRSPSFSLSTRPILAATEGAAWDRARAILDRVLLNRGGAPAPQRQNVDSKRLLQAAAQAEVHDPCLWT
jgi:alkanesulfonate monooxygenase